MFIFKVHLDMTLVLPRLLKFKLGKYNSYFPIVFVEGQDPDEACFKAIYGLIQTILRQDESVETRLLCRSVKEDIRITKVQCG